MCAVCHAPVCAKGSLCETTLSSSERNRICGFGLCRSFVRKQVRRLLFKSSGPKEGTAVLPAGTTSVEPCAGRIWFGLESRELLCRGSFSCTGLWASACACTCPDQLCNRRGDGYTSAELSAPPFGGGSGDHQETRAGTGVCSSLRGGRQR